MCDVGYDAEPPQFWIAATGFLILSGWQAYRGSWGWWIFNAFLSLFLAASAITSREEEKSP